MKTFLLAAGIGSRLRPITDVTPKCMLSIGGRPMLDLWLDAFDRAGVSEVLVNLHHLVNVVQNHLAERTGAPVVRTSFEPELLGSRRARWSPTGSGWPMTTSSWRATPITSPTSTYERWSTDTVKAAPSRP